MTRLRFVVRVSLVFVFLFLLTAVPPLICGVPLLIVGAVAVAAAYDALPGPLGIVLLVLGVLVPRGGFTTIRVASQRSVIFRRLQCWLLNHDPDAHAWGLPVL